MATDRPANQASELARAEFRNVAGHFASGVTVVTSLSNDGPSGMTANAFTSLSLDPMLVAVCFDKTARTLASVQETMRVGVNVLAAGQAEISTVFASKAGEREKFEGIGWSEHGGVPILDGVIAWFAGSLHDLVEGGDHYVGMVAVEEMAAPGGEPLLYYRGGYSSLERG